MCVWVWEDTRDGSSSRRMHKGVCRDIGTGAFGARAESYEPGTCLHPGHVAGGIHNIYPDNKSAFHSRKQWNRKLKGDNQPARRSSP